MTESNKSDRNYYASLFCVMEPAYGVVALWGSLHRAEADTPEKAHGSVITIDSRIISRRCYVIIKV